MPSTNAKKAAKAVKKGVKAKNDRKIRTSVHFKLPKTLKMGRSAKFSRKAFVGRPTLDQFSTIKYPLCTESCMKQIEENNTLTFICDTRASKRNIADACKSMYDVDIIKIRTLIRPDGQKKAYVRLSPEQEALEVANTIGII